MAFSGFYINFTSVANSPYNDLFASSMALGESVLMGLIITLFLVAGLRFIQAVKVFGLKLSVLIIVLSIIVGLLGIILKIVMF